MVQYQRQAYTIRKQELADTLKKDMFNLKALIDQPVTTLAISRGVRDITGKLDILSC
jgi:hypothetical protein